VTSVDKHASTPVDSLPRPLIVGSAWGQGRWLARPVWAARRLEASWVAEECWLSRPWSAGSFSPTSCLPPAAEIWRLAAEKPVQVRVCEIFGQRSALGPLGPWSGAAGLRLGLPLVLLTPLGNRGRPLRRRGDEGPRWIQRGRKPPELRCVVLLGDPALLREAQSLNHTQWRPVTATATGCNTCLGRSGVLRSIWKASIRRPHSCLCRM
jgi:hypothetical protein